MDGYEGEVSPQEYAKISNIMYLPQTQRDEEAKKLGYRLESQDEDRALFVKDGKAVIGLRGTDIKNVKRGWRDVLTDTAMLFGQGAKTPRFMKNESFVIDTFGKGYKDITVTGHSLGGSGSVALGREYNVKSVAFNPAFGIPAIARGFMERIFERRKNPNITIHTTWTDPVSFGTMASVTGKVYRHKKKLGLPAHAIANFME